MDIHETVLIFFFRFLCSFTLLKFTIFLQKINKLKTYAKLRGRSCPATRFLSLKISVTFGCPSTRRYLWLILEQFSSKYFLLTHFPSNAFRINFFGML